MKNLSLFSLFIVSGLFTLGQDIHFSQFYMTPMQLNPALTGSFDGSHRVHLNYRNQWVAMGSPYKTYDVSYDAPIMQEQWDNTHLGIGGFIYNDQAGDSKMTNMNIGISLSGIVRINNEQIVTAGIQGIYMQRSISYNDLQWDNQFSGGVYNAAIPSGENESTSKYNLLDFGAGASWNYGKSESSMASGDDLKINAGLAVFHLNRADKTFNELYADPTNMRMVAHGGAKIGLKNSKLAIKPTVFYLRDATLNELTFGALLWRQFKLESKYTGAFKESGIAIGGYYRLGDAVIPTLQIDYQNFSLGVSYDINLSSLSVATGGKGGYEIALRYITYGKYHSGKGFSRVNFF